MTPSHDAGSRTPGQSGAWDPTVTNTPARTADFDNYNIEETGSPNYTPGYPQAGPFTPQTPGTMYGSEQSFGPYQASPSPVASANASPSPAGGYGSTPSPAGTGYTPSPRGAFPSPSPTMGYSPMTPGKYAQVKVENCDLIRIGQMQSKMFFPGGAYLELYAYLLI